MIIWVILFTHSSLFSNPDPYVIATHPKGGSHLLMKILNMIHEPRPENAFCHYDSLHFHPNQIEESWHAGGMPWVHLFSPHFTYDYFHRNHPDFKIIVILRDPRDAYVSYAHHVYRGVDISEEEKIDRVFQDEAYFEMSGYLSIFLNVPRFYVVRFEELVGSKGGGDKELQTQTIYDLADYIGMPISTALASAYGDDLFGNAGSINFRKGQIGSWKEALNEEQKEWFKEHFGDELIRLGYEHDYDW